MSPALMWMGAGLGGMGLIMVSTQFGLGAAIGLACGWLLGAGLGAWAKGGRA